jgi:hypothetical protein
MYIAQQEDDKSVWGSRLLSKAGGTLHLTLTVQTDCPAAINLASTDTALACRCVITFNPGDKMIQVLYALLLQECCVF